MSARRLETVSTTAGGKTVVATRPAAIARVIPTAASMSDPVSVARLLQEMQRELARIGAMVQGAHDAGAVVFKNVAFTGGTVVQLSHTLRRPFQGWRIERPRGSTGFNPLEQANTTALPAKAYLLLLSSASGAADVVIW